MQKNLVTPEDIWPTCIEKFLLTEGQGVARRLRIFAAVILVWVVAVSGVIAGTIPPADASPAASSPAAAVPGGQVQSLALARSGLGVEFAAPAPAASVLDQIEEDMIDRLEQKAVGQISRPGFEMWPSSNQLQLVGLPSWFKVEDAAWKTISVEEKFANAVASSSAGPARVQYEFEDGIYSCFRQGVAWSQSADSSQSCQRSWDHTTAVVAQQVRARLVYDFDWTLHDAAGSFVAADQFTVVGQWSDWLELTIGELGTVASDGSSPSQVAPARGVDMVTASYVAPSGNCGWGFLCGVGRAIGSLWNWSQATWDTWNAPCFWCQVVLES